MRLDELVSHGPEMATEAERLLAVLFTETFEQLKQRRAQGIAE
jgi:hypothetical protein